MLTQELYIFSVAISIIIYYHISKDYKGLAILVRWSLIFIFITAILSIYSSYIDPRYARNIVSGAYDEEELRYYQRLGGGSYGFVGSLIFLFPMMVYFYKKNEKSVFSKLQILIFGIVCFYALIRIQIVANTLVVIIVVFISLLGRTHVKQSLSLSFIFIVLLFIIPTHLYADLFRSLSTYFPNKSELSLKFNDIANYLVLSNYYDTATASRAARYPLLLNGFMENPFLGYYQSDASYDISAGAHIYWMNKLTIFGIIGFILYSVTHFIYLKWIVKIFDKEFLFYFFISIMGGLGLGLIKNLSGREFWYTYFIILPGLYYLPLLKKQKTIKSTNNNKISHKKVNTSQTPRAFL